MNSIFIYKQSTIQIIDPVLELNIAFYVEVFDVVFRGW